MCRGDLPSTFFKAEEILFQKTKLCKFNEAGRCRKGTRCPYAHGTAELQALPDFHCTKICPLLRKVGICTDRTCRFAHTRKELRRRMPVVSQVEASQSFEMEMQPSSKLHSMQLCPSVEQIEQDERESTKVEVSLFDALSDVKMVRTTSWRSADGSASTFACTNSSSTSECGESTAAGWQSQNDLAYDREFMKPGGGSSSSQDERSSSKASSKSSASVDNRDLFFKTKMCMFHARGKCKRGDACRFAHTPEEMRPLPTTHAALSFEIPSDEGSRSLVMTMGEEKYYLAVKYGFLTVACEVEAEKSNAPLSTGKRARSLPPRLFSLPSAEE